MAVLRLLRPLLALLLACGALALVGTPAQAACTCDAPSVRQAAQGADVVFRGTVVRQRVQGNVRSYSLEVERIYRGRVAETPVVVESPAQASRCGLGRLADGSSYVVFGLERAAALRTSRCEGTEEATPRFLRQVEEVLGAGNPLPQPEEPAPTRPEVAYTRVADTEPPDLTRLAAPGAALVLAGLLGLLVFRRRG